MMKVNSIAPNFTLPSYENNAFGEVSLESLRGKWIYLCFYPGDFTFV